MKNRLWSLAKKAWVTFPCILTTAGALAQGTVNLANKGAGFDAPFFDEQGTRLQGSNYVAQLFYWSPEFTFEPAGNPVPFLSITNGYGYFFGGSVALPGVPGGARAWVQVRAWQVEGGQSFEQAAFLAGAWTGLSEVLFLPYTGDPSSPGVPIPPVDLAGLEYPGKPLLVSQPRSRAIAEGGQTTLSVIASSGVTMAYQWYQQPNDRPDGLIVGATNATYTTPPLTNTTTFWVSVGNSAGSTLSDRATVAVLPAAPRLALQLEAGQPVLTLDGPTGFTYRIEYSTNLSATNWTSLVEVSLSTSPFTFVDSGATNSPVRFYRAVAQ